ncbi:MAG TPA: CehA/McbA family metallohydrolase [Dehalococcoidia bacterium]|nr:CehA/McbA family metallohydrolase [Dehalococcoidia bacterium]
MQQILCFEGHITAEQARREPYLYLPFSVPQHTRRIDVSYDYHDPCTAAFGLGPGSVLDIGLFDSRGREFIDGAGFRGWSGSARQEVFVSTNEATPGYIHGPLFPGQWNVMLGVARADPEGLRYAVNVTLDIAETAAGVPLELPALAGGATATAVKPVGRPDDRGGRWLKGDLHCHTVHSDGLNTVREIVDRAVELGLDFLAVTDHNTNTHHEDLEALSDLPIILIPGEEVTTYWGHANTWGLREWIEYRCADQESMEAVQRFIASRGGLFSINHPKCIGPPWLFTGWEGYNCMEVWQAPWRFYNWESLERWDSLLQRGERVVAVGGSDTHSIPPAEPRHPHGLAEPTTWVYAGEPSEAGVLAAIRAGHAFITDSPNRGAHLELLADADHDGAYDRTMGDTVPPGVIRFRVKVTGGDERRLWLITDGAPIDIITLDRDESVIDFSLDISGRRYVRAELRGRRGHPERGEVIWAMTNPIWVEAK